VAGAKRGRRRCARTRRRNKSLPAPSALIETTRRTSDGPQGRPLTTTCEEKKKKVTKTWMPGHPRQRKSRFSAPRTNSVPVPDRWLGDIGRPWLRIQLRPTRWTWGRTLGAAPTILQFALRPSTTGFGDAAVGTRRNGLVGTARAGSGIGFWLSADDRGVGPQQGFAFGTRARRASSCWWHV